ncbi:hypothetical protein KC669_00045 [Candidatus Dojkabacteria bacterium]|uniref:Carboxypeptidase regulatory-like domain-containing protein n=1 Tax=Candidatus Dojkabacteria bacterium TaxID=2099670 RepID=A0A955LA25_9BACT|nr:hypothetical protein [Candidatus Dojkabacteria bacterium]
MKITNIRRSRQLLLFVFVALFGILLIIPFEKVNIINAATLTWDGGGGDNNWSTCANWTTDTCPGTLDTVIFDGTSTKDAAIDASFTGIVRYLTISSGYTGTITANRSITVVLNFGQADGIFDLTDQSGTFTTTNITGGLFTASSTDTTFKGPLTIDNSSYFDANGGNVILAPASNVTYTYTCNNTVFNQVTISPVAANATLNMTDSCNFPLGSNPTISSSSTIKVYGDLSGTGELGWPAANLQIYSTGTLTGFSGYNTGALRLTGKTLDWSGATTFAMTGNLTIESSGGLTLPLPTGTIQIYDLTVSTSSTFTASSGTMNVRGDITLSNGTTFDSNGGTINLNPTGNVSYDCYSHTFDLITINPVNNNIDLNINSTCNFPLGDNPTITGTNVDLNLDGTLSGTGTLTASADNLFVVSGSILSGFDGLEVSRLYINGANLDLSSYSTLITNSNFELISGSFVAPSGEMEVKANFYHTAGTFTHNSGTINFSGTGIQTITGSTTFNNFTKVMTADVSSSLRFTSNTTQTIEGDMTLHGYSDSQRLNLIASSNTVQWNIDPQGTRDLQYLSVKDSNNINASVIVLSGTGSNDAGNNTNYDFANSAPDAPNTLGPSGYVNGSSDTDTTPTLTFKISDVANPLDTLRFRIQISDTNDFSNVLVDYTSALAAAGSKTFTVGQAVGSGTYNVGSIGQTLDSDSYYWRVKTIDNSAAESAYSTANSGSIAFIVAGYPNLPYAFGPANKIDGSDSTEGQPNLYFTLDDPNAGDTVKYQIQISLASDFSTQVVDYTSDLRAQGVSNFTVGQAAGSGSYTTGSSGQSLGSGSYYWRVKAIDINNEESVFKAASFGGIAFVVSNPPDAPTNLGPNLLITGGLSTDDTPTFSFDLSDSDVGDTVKYRIDISTNSDYSALAASFTSALSAQGSASFTVGQSLNGGSYFHGSVGMDLNDGDYYWRVKAIDSNGVEGTYTLANAGGIAFSVGGNPPDTPSSPGPVNLINGSVIQQQQPSFTFYISDPDLDQVKYRIQISKRSSFNPVLINYESAFGSIGTKTFTVGQASNGGTYYSGSEGQVLAPGDYYWKIRAIDISELGSPYLIPNGANVAFTVSSDNANSDTPLEYVPELPAEVVVEVEESTSNEESTSSGSGSSSSQPTIKLNLSDSNSSQQLQFQIEIDNESDYEDPEVIYKSGLMEQGEASFVVGQTTGDGQYLNGSEGQILGAGDYYVRAKTIDEKSNESEYFYINNGSVAFIITPSSELEIIPPTEISTNNNPTSPGNDSEGINNLSDLHDVQIEQNGLNAIGEENSPGDVSASAQEVYVETKTLAKAFTETISKEPITIPLAVVATTTLATLIAYPRIILLMIVVIKNMFRKKKQWGIVYDKNTLSIIPLATIRLYSSDNKYLRETITDFKGQYGFVVDAGDYILQIKHSEYISTKEKIRIEKEEDLLTSDIELNKSNKKRMSIFKKIQKSMRERLPSIWQGLFFIGFAVAVISFINASEAPNLFILLMFVFSIAFYTFRSIIFASPWGYLYDLSDNSRISRAIVRVINTKNNKVEEITVTDEKGRFLIKNKKGNYKLMISSDKYTLPDSENQNISIKELNNSSLKIGLEKSADTSKNNVAKFGVL